MLEHGMAATSSFAFAAILTREPAGAVGRVWFAPAATPDAPCPTLEYFAHALVSRLPLHWHGAGGKWMLDWFPPATPNAQGLT
jgi:hypothetical protein